MGRRFSVFLFVLFAGIPAISQESPDNFNIIETTGIEQDDFRLEESTRVVQSQGAKPETDFVKDEIKLSSPQVNGAISIEECISKRRSVTQFENRDLNLQQISQLLWAGQGITGASGKRSAPSAGDLYPMELYVVISSGIFRYIPQDHKIVRIIEGDFRRKLSDACLGQYFVAEAGATIVIVADYKKTTWKYGIKGIRFVNMEAGHIAENLQLQAVALGLGSIPVGRFSDKRVKDLLKISSKTQPIYVISIGFPK